MVELMRNRIGYIDAAKGILIICLFYGHSAVYGEMLGIDIEGAHLIWKTIGLYDSFFMQTFFIITGFCSSFDGDFGKFVWKCIKTILIPGMLLSLLGNLLYGALFFEHVNYMDTVLKICEWFTLGGEWFIMALFLSKLITWFILKACVKAQLYIIIVLYFVGLYLNYYDLIPNYIWHRHTLLLLPFLYMGCCLKKKMNKIEPFLKPIGIIGIFLIAIETLLCNKGYFDRPFLAHGINVYLYNSPIHFVNVIGGTSFIFWLSKKVSNIEFLCTIGRGSLFMFLWNGVFIRIFILCICRIDIIDTHNQYTGFIFYLIVTILSIIVGWFFVKIILCSSSDFMDSWKMVIVNSK